MKKLALILSFAVAGAAAYSTLASAQPTPPSSVKITDGVQTLDITSASAAKIDGSAVTQPVSAVSLPLPSGAATEATLSTLNGKVTAVNTGAVVVSSSALPSGAATEASLASLNGKVTAVNTGAVTISSALPAGTNAIGKLSANSGVDIGDVDVTSVSGTVSVAGTVAHDGTDSGNPVKIGYKAYSSNPTAVSTGDRADGISDLIGRQVTAPYSIPENTWSSCLAADITDTTSTSIKSAGAGSVRHYITGISISNMAAAVATRVDVLDGSTVVFTCPAAAAGGGCTVALPVPIRGTAATAINIQPATTSSAG